MTVARGCQIGPVLGQDSVLTTTGHLQLSSLRPLHQHRPWAAAARGQRCAAWQRRGPAGARGGSSHLVAAAAGASSQGLPLATLPKAPHAAPASLEFRPASIEDYWAVADVHCHAFYPHASAFWQPLLRLDRVLSLRVGSETRHGQFACLVAVGQLEGQPYSASAADTSSSGGSSSGSGSGSSMSAACGSSGSSNGGAKSGTVDMGTLEVFVRTFLPDSMQVNFGSNHEAQGIRGAVVVDTMALYVPPKRIITPGGNTRDIRRSHIAYLSNLAVSPSAQRRGVGRELLLRAEATARSWGCRSMALHVDATNEAARQLYKGEGYREISQQSRWEQLLEGRHTPLVLMLKRLGSGGSSGSGGGSGSSGRAGASGSSS